ncbi:MAG: VOC family protein [Betaproteobacteria bacterium]|nr:VOC family protein [Betaproteobacteria bacterium]
MRFRYTIAYVTDVQAELDFFVKAFGLARRFVHEAGDYAELETGSCILAFASHQLGGSNLPQGYRRADASAQPLGIEVGFVVEDLAAAHAAAIAAGASELRPPHQTAWGQQVSWLRSPQGLLIELGTEPAKD